jgi:acyl carrier protein
MPIVKDLPTRIKQAAPPVRVTERVRRAVISEYTQLTQVPEDEIVAGFDGGVAFDSLLGVEMSVGLEERLGVPIGEDKLKQPRLYRSLGAFAVGIQECVDEHEKEGSPQ